jgi:hypothetical protein
MNLSHRTEGWIESLDVLGSDVQLVVSLGDGALASLRIDREEIEWLDWRVGQSVPLPESLSEDLPGDPGGAVLRQGADPGGEMIGGDIGQADGFEDPAHIGPQRDPDALQRLGWAGVDH